MVQKDLIHVVVSVISVVVLVKIYHYLIELENCKCFQIQNGMNYQADLEFLKFYQVLEIVSLLLFFISTYLLNQRRVANQGGAKHGLRFISIISFIVLLYIFSYMSYNVFNLFMNVKEGCKCADKWQKYFIYAQGLMTSISTLQLVFGFLFSISIIIVGAK
jgi:hypothetical protein